MEDRLSFDTSFLIDLQRERTKGRLDGPAHAFLRARPETKLALSAVALGEFAEGFADAHHLLIQLTLDAYEILVLDAQVASYYARAVRTLRHAGRLIGANDLWIAATALRHGLPLVTANVDHFSRVADLQVIPYRTA